MTDPLTRAQQLIAKANDSATTQEEARTCAMVAVKLIGQHKMRLVMGDSPRPAPAPEGPPGSRARPPRAHGSPFGGNPFAYNEARWARGKPVGTCSFCYEAIYENDQPQRREGAPGVMHPRCAERFRDKQAQDVRRQNAPRCCICGEGPRTDAPFIDTGEVVDGRMLIVHGGLCQMRWGERVAARQHFEDSYFTQRPPFDDDPKAQAQERYRKGWDRTFIVDDPLKESGK